jgi:hypothetical protein
MSPIATSFIKFLARLTANVVGNALPIIAMAFIPVAALIGGGIDAGRAYVVRQKLQTACDAAVLSARQSMTGASFSSANELRANQFFAFNFPDGTMGTDNVSFTVSQQVNDPAQLDGQASAEMPTSVMRIFGFETMDVAVNCDAVKELGNNDIMVVMDVTGSMNCPPGTAGGCGGVEQPGSKGSRLRAGMMALYNSLADDTESNVRYGMVPYSGTVNVGRSLTNDMIVRNMKYPDCTGYGLVAGRLGSYYGCSNVTYDDYYVIPTSLRALTPGYTWPYGGDTTTQMVTAWRNSGQACIEERPSVGNNAWPVLINDTVTRADIDTMSSGTNDIDRKWRRYDWEEWSVFPKSGTKIRSAPYVISDAPYNQSACPSEAIKLRSYASESEFETAVNAATTKLTGGTFHDIGMIWGMRFLSPTGMFAASNPTTVNGAPVNKHLIFFTDGKLDTYTNPFYYSAYGLMGVENRVLGSGTRDEKHLRRFHSACNLARDMDMTVWVIALDVADVSAIEPCANGPDYFFTSDGSDLEAVFEEIGKKIGQLRLSA